MREKWKEVLGGIFLFSLLTACGVSNEEQIIGSWQSVTYGEKQNRYLLFRDDQTVTTEQYVPDMSGREEYQIRDTDEGSFNLEIDDPGDESSLILEMVNPSYEAPQGVFEAYFEDEDTIIIGSNSNDNKDILLIRIDSIEEAHGEWMRER